MDQDRSILEVLDRYRATALAKDIDGHVALYDDDVLLFDAWGEWSLRGIGALRAMVTEWLGSLGSERVVVEWDEVRVQSQQDLACVTAIVKYTAVSSEGAVVRWLQNRFTAVLSKKGTDWKIMHQHTSGPADNDTMKVLLKRP